MNTAIRQHEQQRLDALRQTGLLDALDTTDHYDRITQVAAQSLNMPVCLFSLIAEEHQFFRARYGTDLQETPRNISFCAHTLKTNGLLIVEDASRDPRFCMSPLVNQAPYFRFYAGMPIYTSCGAAIGSLCVLDYQPRTLSPAEQQLLQGFAGLLQQQLPSTGLPQSIDERLPNDVQSTTALAHWDDPHNLLESVVDANRIGIWRLNTETDELLINEHWAEGLGYSLSELMPATHATWQKLTHPEDVSHCRKLLQQHRKNPAVPYHVRIRMQHKQGHWVWISSRGKLIGPERRVLLGTHIDISEQVKAEQAMKEQSKTLRAIVDNMINGIMALDGRGQVISANPAACAIFGYSGKQLSGVPLSQLIPAPEAHANPAIAYDNLHQHLQLGHGGKKLLNLAGRHASGHLIPIEAAISVAEREGQRVHILILRDISERQAAEAEISWLAHYDPLTRLPNRQLLTEVLKKTLAGCRRYKHHCALLFVDLDNFKLLNDTAGHNTGDQLLQKVARRLQAQVREDDTVARLSGDEFMIIADRLHSNSIHALSQAAVIAEKIRKALNDTYQLDDTLYRASCSIGVSLIDATPPEADEVLKQADMAMYQAKAEGRNQVRFFDPSIQEALHHKSTMERDLGHALDRQELKLYLQNQVDDQGSILGAEALLRWQHPDKGLVSPADFIPMAEETGLIVPIGEWVLRQSCKLLAHWAGLAQRRSLTLSVNISVVQFYQKDFVSTVKQILLDTGAPPTQLKLEITESVVARDIDLVILRMNELRQLGIAFSLDDFGTGYSSLSYLKKLPFDQLKIDQGFVCNILDSHHDQAIAETIITLGKKLGLDIIAEGVETESQYRLLKRLGCTCYQGYYFGKPSAESELTQQQKD